MGMEDQGLSFLALALVKCWKVLKVDQLPGGLFTPVALLILKIKKIITIQIQDVSKKKFGVWYSDGFHNLNTWLFGTVI